MYIIYTINQTMHALWVKTNPITVKGSEGNISLGFPPLPHPRNNLFLPLAVPSGLISAFFRNALCGFLDFLVLDFSRIPSGHDGQAFTSLKSCHSHISSVSFPLRARPTA